MEGIDSHVGIGIVEGVAGSEEEHGFILTTRAIGRIDAVEAGSLTCHVCGFSATEGHVTKDRVIDVGATVPLDDIWCTSGDTRQIVTETEGQRPFIESSRGESFHRGTGKG